MLGQGVLEPRDLPVPSQGRIQHQLLAVTQGWLRSHPVPNGVTLAWHRAPNLQWAPGLDPRGLSPVCPWQVWPRGFGSDPSNPGVGDSPVCPSATCVPGTSCAVRKELLCGCFLWLPCPGVSHLLRSLLPIPGAPCTGWVQLGAPGLWGALGGGASPLPIVGSASFHLWLACGRLDEKGN